MKYISSFVLNLCFVLCFGQIKSPSSYLGYELGEEFTQYHKVVDYYNYLSDKSPNVNLFQYGVSYEGHPLYTAFISSSENLENLDLLRDIHANAILKKNMNEEKIIIWLSYSIHGNESSPTETSMKTVYNLITEKINWLDDVIVIVDPCANPDGRNRYVNFFKQSKSIPNDTNLVSREHHEPWHSGRTNHYMFDLNRDWTWLSQIETQQRIVLYNKWLPHIHVDFHEQGINSPYYFAPASKPYHDIITDFQAKFQKTIGKNNAKYFDQNGWLYFTKQIFDLVYPGYGDTYPTFMGAIGMTYEQAGGGRAGLKVKTNTGQILSLKDRIEHHHTTGISTIEVALENRKKLIENFQKFYQIQNPKYANYILEGPESTLQALSRLLQKHEINSSRLASTQSTKGYDYQELKSLSREAKKGSLVVSANQPKGKMVQVLLEPTTMLSDSLTYDITAWSLPYAYGLKTLATNQNLRVETNHSTPYDIKTNHNTYGYVIDYRSFEDSKILAQLLKKKLKIRYNTKKLTNSGKTWELGSLFILKADNLQTPNWQNVLLKICKNFEKPIHSLSTGFSDEGVDLGSNDLKLLDIPVVGLLFDKNALLSSYGEIWHFFEQEIQYNLIQVPTDQLTKALPEIDVLILASGNYNFLVQDSEKEVLMNWLKSGGKIIAIAKALNSFINDDSFSLEKKENPDTDYKLISKNRRTRESLNRLITGSIYHPTIDTSHPLNYGIQDYYTLKTSSDSYELLENGYNASYLSEDAKQISGFVGHEVKELQSNSLLFGQEHIGKGSIIYLVDNPLFRSFWYQGKQLFSNAIFFE